MESENKSERYGNDGEAEEENVLAVHYPREIRRTKIQFQDSLVSLPTSPTSSAEQSAIGSTAQWPDNPLYGIDPQQKIETGRLTYRFHGMSYFRQVNPRYLASFKRLFHTLKMRHKVLARRAVWFAVWTSRPIVWPSIAGSLRQEPSRPVLRIGQRARKKMQSLKLTRDIGRLTQRQRIFYEINGYLVISRLIPIDILDRCSKRFDDIISGKVPQNMMTVMRDVTDKKSVNKIQDFVHDSVFREYVENKTMLDIVESFTGPDIVAMNSMLIAKPPDIGSKSSRHPPHQDLYYFPFRPADRIVATWTAIESCNIVNGCLYVSPGSHIPGVLYPHGYPQETKPTTINKFYHEIQGLPESISWISLEMEPGDTLFFHPLLVHGSGVNRSTRTRKAISCHYAAADCKYIDVRGTVQETIRTEIMELVDKRFPNSDLNYEDVWRVKSKLVRGIRSSL